MQCARDRRCSHRKDIESLFHFLEAFLLLDAEALLLIDDQQPQILEQHVRLEQRMRADDDVDFAFRESRENLLRLLRRAESAEGFDLYRKARETIAERVCVLLYENRRWR